MQKKLTILWVFAFFVLVVGWAITPAQAHHCKGGHANAPDCDGGGGGGGGDGDGNQTEPAEIIFTQRGEIDRDQDKPYRDFRLDPLPNEPNDGVDVAIGSKANKGNIFLVTSFESRRRLAMDFSNCVPPPGEIDCALPDFLVGGSFPGSRFPAWLRVDVGDVLKNGVYDIPEDESTEAPMRVQFQEDAGGVPYDKNLFLHFDHAQRNCGSDLVDFVTVKNKGGDMWEVSGNNIRGCLVPAGKPHPEPLGYFDMSFEFTVKIIRPLP